MKPKDERPGFHAELVAELGRRANADAAASAEPDRNVQIIAAENEAARVLLLQAMPWLSRESSLVDAAKTATLVLMTRDELRQRLDSTLDQD